jgi:hypothetical protein
MGTVLAPTDVAKQTVERTAAVRIDCVVVKKPGISPLGFVENGLYVNFSGHLTR